MTDFVNCAFLANLAKVIPSHIEMKVLVKLVKSFEANEADQADEDCPLGL